MKTCSKCAETKAVEMFSKGRGQCKACVDARQRAYLDANRETVLAQRKAYYTATREVFAAKGRVYREEKRETVASRKKAYRQANAEVLAQRAKEYREANPHVVAAGWAKRHAAKMQRTPAWLTADHYDQIAAVYAERDALTKATGIEHHVDHIIPLQGTNVSGLHTPWNLRVIPAFDNFSKNNRYTGPDSWAA